MTIWKFPLEITEEQLVEIPRAARPLSVQFQGDGLVLWAMVDPAEALIVQRIAILGTGEDATWLKDWTYLGTVQERYRPLVRSSVWHVFIR